MRHARARARRAPYQQILAIFIAMLAKEASIFFRRLRRIVSFSALTIWRFWRARGSTVSIARPSYYENPSRRMPTPPHADTQIRRISSFCHGKSKIFGACGELSQTLISQTSQLVLSVGSRVPAACFAPAICARGGVFSTQFPIQHTSPHQKSCRLRRQTPPPTRAQNRHLAVRD